MKNEHERMIKTSENTWYTNSDICGYKVTKDKGVFNIFSFD